MQPESQITRLKTASGNWIEPETLHHMLADAGYSGGTREEFLRTVLTELSRAEETASQRQTRLALLSEVRQILSYEQGKAAQAQRLDTL